MRKKVIAAGHICLDITPVFPETLFSDTRVRLPGELLSPGKLLHMDGADVHTGGAVANTGLAMNFFGADVTLMGKIGADEFGKLILEILNQYGYDGSRDMIISEESSTSYSVVLAIPGVDRIFLHSPGANDTFCCNDLNFQKIAEAALFHFGYPPLMKRMYAGEGRELVRMFRKVKELGTATSLDMAAVDPASEAGQADWRKILEQVIPYVDFFVPSAEELCYMLDRERYEEWVRRAAGRDVTEILDIEEDIKPLADELLTMGAKVILIKCGAPGVYYRTAGKEMLDGIGCSAGIDSAGWADQEGFERSYVPERVRSGTGAGDTTIAAFLTAMLEGRSLENCMHLAAGSGASCVEGYDALSGLRSLDELEKKIEAGWAKQERKGNYVSELK